MIWYRHDQNVKRTCLPVSQRRPVKPEGHTHVFGDAHAPPLRQASWQHAGERKQTLLSLKLFCPSYCKSFSKTIKHWAKAKFYFVKKRNRAELIKTPRRDKTTFAHLVASRCLVHMRNWTLSREGPCVRTCMKRNKPLINQHLWLYNMDRVTNQ